VPYGPGALRAGVQLRTHCRVREVLVDADDRATGVVYFDAQGVERVQRAHVVILACNGIGTARLLLNSTSAHFPDGLANRSGLVGRNLMLHPWAMVRGVFEGPLGAQFGPMSCSIWSQQFYETDASRGFVRGYNLQVTRAQGPATTARYLFGHGALPWGHDHHRVLRRHYGNMIGIGVCCEDLPEEANRVTLHPTLTDSSGIPAPKVTYRRGDNTRRMLEHGVQRAAQALQTAGATDWRADAPWRPTGWHLLGTARMGRDPQRSVVNEWGRCHDVKNLFIVDGSVFVTGGGVNPTATIQALALHIADVMKRRLADLFD
jgi:choline dehydrogenase-like flavoprotein